VSTRAAPPSLAALIVLAALAPAALAHAQTCMRPGPDRIACRFLSSGRERMDVVAVARLHHLVGPAGGAVLLKLDGRPCDLQAARWQLGAGEARASCPVAGATLRHNVEAQLYGVRRARALDFSLVVQPSAGGLERLPVDRDALAPARASRRSRGGRLWPF
jgi:hypothetical protein